MTKMMSTLCDNARYSLYKSRTMHCSAEYAFYEIVYSI